ncbi:MAG TPA: DNA cytosine methyltransferase [Jiangellaceae bacterium]
MPETRIAGLCSGTGALEMAVQEVLGGTFVWHCQWEPPDKNGKPDKWQYAARILAHHWPDVPNHGDITKVDWSTVERPNVLAMGFPCTDVSSAGQRAGIAEGTRSGVWFHCARAIEELRPDLVVIENVEGLLSARADRGVGATDADVEAAGDDALRALGCVLGDLADRGYDAEWCRVAASDVGAPHRRYRIIILAWLTADAESFGRGQGRTEPARKLGGPDAAVGGRPDGIDPAGERHERGRQPRGGRARLEDGDQSPAYPAGERHGNTRPASERGFPPAPVTGAVADPHSDPVRQQPVPEPRCGGEAVAGVSGHQWGVYGPAIRRWEHILGRPAPRPVDDRGRLAAPFVEWVMGLPEGHVCAVPAPEGMTAAGLRNARLKALGNGVVRQQAAYALRLLLERASQEVAA